MSILYLGLHVLKYRKGSSFSLKNWPNLGCFDIMSLLNVKLYRLCHGQKPVWSVSQKSAQSWMFSFDIMSLYI